MLVAGTRLGHIDRLLQPAVCAAKRVGVDGVGQVLMHAYILPPNATGVWIKGLPRFGPFQNVEYMLIAILAEPRQARHACIDVVFILQAPAAQMVAHGDDAWLDPFSQPRLVDKVTNLCFDLDQIARHNAQPRPVRWMHPDGVFVADFVEPFGVGAAGVDEGGQAEVGQE